MSDIRKFIGKIISCQNYCSIKNGKKIYDSVILLDDQRVIEIYGDKPLYFDYLDEVEFFGRNAGYDFHVFSFKIVNKYKRRKNPAKFQKSLSDFENKKQEGSSEC